MVDDPNLLIDRLAVGFLLLWPAVCLILEIVNKAIDLFYNLRYLAWKLSRSDYQLEHYRKNKKP